MSRHPKPTAEPSSCQAVTSLIRDWAAVRPDLDTWAYRFFASATELERQLNLALVPTFDELGINGGDYEVLSQLRRAGAPYERTPTALSQLMYLTTGAMTRRLDRLEAGGYLKRVPHGSDRRSIVVRLTPAGLVVVDEAINRILPVISQIMEPVRDRVEDFEQIARAILDNLPGGS